MKRTTILLIAILAAVLAILPGLPAGASNKIAQLEGLQCTTCHAKPGSRLLTDRGKYYEVRRSLDGYDEVIAAFSECTGCHVSKPGSKKLTETGKAFALVVKDMEGLRLWLAENHPKPRGSH
jgi:hypothetical protein